MSLHEEIRLLKKRNRELLIALDELLKEAEQGYHHTYTLGMNEARAVRSRITEEEKELRQSL